MHINHSGANINIMCTGPVQDPKSQGERHH